MLHSLQNVWQNGRSADAKTHYAPFFIPCFQRPGVLDGTYISWMDYIAMELKMKMTSPRQGSSKSYGTVMSIQSHLGSDNKNLVNGQ